MFKKLNAGDNPIEPNWNCIVDGCWDGDGDICGVNDIDCVRIDTI